MPRTRSRSIDNLTTPAYDDNGNTLTDEANQDYVYDAWNRMVEALDASDVSLETFAYDALGRRITEDPASGSARELYLSGQLQVVEERVSGTTSVQYVWSPVYVNAMVERDSYAGTAGALDTSFDTDGKVTTELRRQRVRPGGGRAGRWQDRGSGHGRRRFRGCALQRRRRPGHQLRLRRQADHRLRRQRLGQRRGDPAGRQDRRGRGRPMSASTTPSPWPATTPTAVSDTSFDSDGKVTTDFDSFEDYGRAMVLQADGKIIVGGYSAAYRQRPRLCFGPLQLRRVAGQQLRLRRQAHDRLRWYIDGDLRPRPPGRREDSGGRGHHRQRHVGHGLRGGPVQQRWLRWTPSFDSDGKVTTDFGGVEYCAWPWRYRATGRSLVVGYTDASRSDWALARYNADGSLDTNFDSDGKVTTDFGGEDAGVCLLQADGKIVVVGMAGGDFAVARYNADGSLDTSFDSDGKVTTDFGGTECGLRRGPDARRRQAGGGRRVGRRLRPGPV